MRRNPSLSAYSTARYHNHGPVLLGLRLVLRRCHGGNTFSRSFRGLHGHTRFTVYINVAFARAFSPDTVLSPELRSNSWIFSTSAKLVREQMRAPRRLLAPTSSSNKHAQRALDGATEHQTSPKEPGSTRYS